MASLTRAYLTPEELQKEKQFPLHFAISVKDAGIEETILKAHSASAESIHQRDADGLTPIHVAAMSQNFAAVCTLLTLGVENELQDADNERKMAPLELFTVAMLATRNIVENILNAWDGYSADALKCEYMLKQALGMPLSPPEEDVYIEKRKYGCTCGNCLEGWFSERMKYRLETTAIVKHEVMRDEMMLSGRRRRKRSSFDIELDLYSEFLFDDEEFIPPAIRSQINYSFTGAWCYAFKAIYNVLQGPNPILNPTSPTFRLSMADFLYKGGKVEYVLDALTSIAKEQSSLGDGSFEDAHGETYDELPTCDNDLAFNLVRRKIGLDPRTPWAPYYYPARDGGFYDSEDDDDDSDY